MKDATLLPGSMSQLSSPSGLDPLSRSAASSPSLAPSKYSGRAPVGGLNLAEDLIGPSGKARYKGGQFIPIGTWRYERARAYQHLPILIATVNNSLSLLLSSYQQNIAISRIPAATAASLGLIPIDPKKIEAEIMRTVAQSQEDSMVLGRRAGGNFTSLGAGERVRLDKLISTQNWYMNRFLETVKAGEGVMSYEQRMDYYGRSVRASFWDGYLTATSDPSRTITWHPGNTIDKCETCVAMAKKGPIPIKEFMQDYGDKGIMPGSGELACHGFFCDCYLTEN